MSDISLIGKKVPEFSAPATSGTTFHLHQTIGQPLVLYFYPKDNTPGCTTEAAQFRNHYPEFCQLGCRIFGISRDSLSAHEKFKAQLALPFELIADTEGTICRLFDVIREKTMYGRKTTGIERSTFLIDAVGVVCQEWRKLKVEGHAAEVLAAVRAIP